MDKQDHTQDHEGYNHHESDKPLPKSPNWSGEKWLPKTDWSRDGIIASED